MSAREELIEVAARASWEAEGKHIVPWPGRCEDVEIYYTDAEVMLDAALASGLCVLVEEENNG
jgi:hypothetical protein